MGNIKAVFSIFLVYFIFEKEGAVCINTGKLRLYGLLLRRVLPPPLVSISFFFIFKPRKLGIRGGY